MLRSWHATLLAAAVAALPPSARAQVVRYGVIGDSVRAQLGRAWSTDYRQSERGYCVRRAYILARPVSRTAVDSIFRVLEVRPAHPSDADPNHVAFECTPGTPELHTHPPATCYNANVAWCEAGGPDAYSCQPSRADYEELIRRGDPFGIIQCDRWAYRFYYPSDYRPMRDTLPPPPAIRPRQ